MSKFISNKLEVLNKQLVEKIKVFDNVAIKDDVHGFRLYTEIAEIRSKISELQAYETAKAQIGKTAIIPQS